MTRQSANTSFHAFLRLVFRRRRLFMVGAVVFAVAALAVSHFIPLKYSGKAVFEFGLEAAAEEISRTSAESFGTIKERLSHDLAGYQAMEASIGELRLTEGLPRDGDGRLTQEGQAALQQMVSRFMDATEVVWEARSKQEDLISIRPKEKSTQTLLLSTSGARVLTWVPLVVVPALALIAGLLMYFRRRKYR